MMIFLFFASESEYLSLRDFLCATVFFVLTARFFILPIFFTVSSPTFPRGWRGDGASPALRDVGSFRRRRVSSRASLFFSTRLSFSRTFIVFSLYLVHDLGRVPLFPTRLLIFSECVRAPFPDPQVPQLAFSFVREHRAVVFLFFFTSLLFP